VFTTSGVTLCRADEEAQVVGMKTARYFLIRKREDGAVAFWYKPSPAHAHLYPSKKGADGSPMYTMVDGEKQYITCPDGIEIFHHKDGPSAVSPPLAEFPRKKDDDQPYFQIDVCRKAMVNIASKIPDVVGPDFHDKWVRFLDDYPKTLNDVPKDELPRWELPPTQDSGLELPPHISETQKEFAETIEYSNPSAGQILRSKQVARNREEQQGTQTGQATQTGHGAIKSFAVTGIKVNHTVVVDAPTDLECDDDALGSDIAQSFKTPVWLCDVCDVSDPNTVDVAWRCAWNNGPSDEIARPWNLVCKGWDRDERTGKIIYHKFVPGMCNRKKGHGLWIDKIERESIKLIDVGVGKSGIISTKSYEALIGVLPEQHVPEAWKEHVGAQAAKQDARKKRPVCASTGSAKKRQKSSATRKS